MPAQFNPSQRLSIRHFYLIPGEGRNFSLNRCIIIFNLHTAAFKAYCAIWVKRSNFRH